MLIKYFCPVWGMKHLPLDDVLKKIRSSGYTGAEIALDPDLVDISEISEKFAEHNIELLAQLPYPKTGDFNFMLNSYLSKLDRIFHLKPVMINSHTGRDYFTFEQNLTFLREAQSLSDHYGIPIGHETHRSRFSFAAPALVKYLEVMPEIKLTADFSHWCVVGESLLLDQQELIDMAIPRCIYIHARVGYAQGPQVPDFTDAAYVQETQRHLGWWQQIVDYQSHNGLKQLIITPEFGPVPYMHPAITGTDALETQYSTNLKMKDFLTKNIII